MAKKKKRRLKKSVKRFLYFLCFIIVICFIWSFEYNYGLKPVSNSEEKINFEVKKGSTYSTLASSLKDEGLIKSKLFYKIYVKTHDLKPLKAGVYELSPSMSVEQILDAFNTNSINLLSLTFREGLNIRQIASIIEEKTNNKAEDFINLLTDEMYIDSLINDYWFLTDEIKNSDIYYTLEGYLIPDTYSFDDKNVSLKTIIKAMLDNTDKKLSEYKEKLESSDFTIHQILTVASMAELEGITKEDRENVARVFYNRLERGMSLGSDVTTYYGAKIIIGERDLYNSEIYQANAYNTRSSALNGKLPVGPICNPSISAIISSINPNDNNYLYFVADKNRKVYFTENEKEHTKVINKLKKEGLWYEW